MANLSGVYAAAVTPMRPDGRLDLPALQGHLRRLTAQGLTGVLLMGTTGEGTSLSLDERTDLLRAAVEADTSLRIMAGTGTPSLLDTITATREAFALGVDHALLLPPYYYKGVSAQGLADYFRRVLDAAVPEGRGVLLYHIPQVSGVGISTELLDLLADEIGERIIGLKDSSGDLAHACMLTARYPALRVFVGSDSLLLDALRCGVSGAITAGANVLTPLLAALYSGYHAGSDDEALHTQQNKLSAARAVLDAYPPFPASLKRLLADQHGDMQPDVRPPLVMLASSNGATLRERLAALDALF